MKTDEKILLGLDDMNDILIKVIGDFLNGRKSEYSINENIINLAKIHEVQGIVYHQTQNVSLKSAYAYAIYNYQKRMVILNQVEKLFQEAQLPYFS